MISVSEITKRDLIHANAGVMGIATNMTAEANEILKALIYCSSRRIQRVVIDTNSLVILNIITKVWQVPWKIIEMVK